MDNSQIKVHTETEYNSRMKNVKLFTRAIKLNNLMLDASFDDRFKHTLRIIDELENFKTRIPQHIPSFTTYYRVLRKVDIELTSKYFLLLRTAIFYPGANKSDSSNNEEQHYNLEKLVRNITSNEFYGNISKDKNMKMRLRVYNILINADRRESSVQDAFLNTNHYLKEFKTMKTDNTSATLRQAIVNLLRLSCVYTEDIEYSHHILRKFGFFTIVDFLCNDITKAKLDHFKMDKHLRNFMFSSMV